MFEATFFSQNFFSLSASCFTTQHCSILFVHSNSKPVWYLTNFIVLDNFHWPRLKYKRFSRGWVKQQTKTAGNEIISWSSNTSSLPSLVRHVIWNRLYDLLISYITSWIQALGKNWLSQDIRLNFNKTRWVIELDNIARPKWNSHYKLSHYPHPQI